MLPPPAFPPPAPLAGFDVSFDDRNWAGRWFAWRVLKQFGSAAWATPVFDDQLTQILLDLNIVTGGKTGQQVENEMMFNMARDERGSALGEILTQDVEFITAFMEAMAMNPASHYRTFRVLHIASLIGSFAALHYKDHFDRPRPSWEMPGLSPPIPVPGHSSYPSGHATQAYLMAKCMALVLQIAPNVPLAHRTTVTDTLSSLARRVARNREIAGLHYPSDSAAGSALADAVFLKLSELNAAGSPSIAGDYKIKRFGQAVVTAANQDWQLKV